MCNEKSFKPVRFKNEKGLLNVELVFLCSSVSYSDHIYKFACSKNAQIYFVEKSQFK